MSYGFAGALQGLGGGMVKQAEEKRKMAHDLLMVEKRAEAQIAVNAAKPASRRGGGRRRGGGDGRNGFTFSNSDEVRIKETYKATYDDGNDAPSLPEFKTEVLNFMRGDSSLSRMEAEGMAISGWQNRVTQPEVLEDRYGLMGVVEYLAGADGKKTTQPEVREYGFAPRASGPASAPTAAPADSGPPEIGAVINGYRFKGGDPKDQSNWEPA